MENPAPRLLTARELARRLGMSRATLFRLLARGFWRGAAMRYQHGRTRFLRFDEAAALALWEAEQERRKKALEWGKIPVGTP